MITTWSGGQQTDSLAFNDLLAPSAYAQTNDSVKGQISPASPDTPTEKGIWQQIKSGIGIFFGYGKEPQRYWVIVGSFKDEEAARQFADKINTEDMSLHARIGTKLPGNDNYPVIVGDYALLSEAKKIERRALATKSIKEAYLYAGERR